MEASLDIPECQKRFVARKRWKILAKAICQRKELDDESINVSKRAFQTFGLISFLGLGNDIYTVIISEFDVSVRVRLAAKNFSAVDISGFDNTGNICVWPSEEILTYYCLQNPEYFQNKSVVEIGGGMTCLAGLFLAVSQLPKNLFLTDGNSLCVENVAESVKLNSFVIPVHVSVFFGGEHENLIKTIIYILHCNGVALIVAPERGNSFYDFVEKCKVYFEVNIVSFHSKNIYEALRKAEKNPYYEGDLHCPLIAILKKNV